MLLPRWLQPQNRVHYFPYTEAPSTSLDNGLGVWKELNAKVMEQSVSLGCPSKVLAPFLDDMRESKLRFIRV